MTTTQQEMRIPDRGNSRDGGRIVQPSPDNTAIFRATDSELLEMVRLVAYRYKKAAATYRNAARMLAKHEHGELLGSLAERKQEAADMLREKHGVEVAVVSGAGSSAEAQYALDVDFHPIAMLGEAFTFALQRELAEIRLLDQISLRLAQSRLKRFLIGQVAVCRKHVRLLEDDFSRLANLCGCWA
jgi:hypothetical protein